MFMYFCVTMSMLLLWIVSCSLTFDSLQESGEQTETMSSKDAAMFPLMASATLFGLYVFFRLPDFHLY